MVSWMGSKYLSRTSWLILSRCVPISNWFARFFALHSNNEPEASYLIPSFNAIRDANIWGFYHKAKNPEYLFYWDITSIFLQNDVLMPNNYKYNQKILLRIFIKTQFFYAGAIDHIKKFEVNTCRKFSVVWIHFIQVWTFCALISQILSQSS